MKRITEEPPVVIGTTTVVEARIDIMFWEKAGVSMDVKTAERLADRLVNALEEVWNSENEDPEWEYYYVRPSNNRGK